MKTHRKILAWSALLLLMGGAALAAQHESFTGTGGSKADACAHATQLATMTSSTKPWKRVTQMSNCRCSQSAAGWQCMVVVTYAD